jgi:hypothetical protein
VLPRKFSADLDVDLVSVMTGEGVGVSDSVMTGPPLLLLVLDPSAPPGSGLRATVGDGVSAGSRIEAAASARAHRGGWVGGI